jgi:hypothetical protein
MTEYELVDAYASTSALGTTALTFYLTVVSGYLVVAYFAGDELTRNQAVFVTALFVVFGSFAMWGSMAYFYQAGLYITEAAGNTTGDVRPRGLWPHHIVGLMEGLGLIGAVGFMRDIRRRAHEQAADESE